MTVGGMRGLLRGREGELLLDLVYVFALTRISERLIVDLTTQRRVVLPELGQTTLLLLALWLTWVRAAIVTAPSTHGEGRSDSRSSWSCSAP